MKISDKTKMLSWLPFVVLAMASLALYCRALGHDFLINWDDRQYVLENPIINGFDLDRVKTAFTTFYLGNYAPLHLISYMLDYQVWGLRASGFILTNILLHTANGMLFYLLLRRLAGQKVWCFFAALLFVLHPVQVESVVWISQRKNVLAMFFFLLSFNAYALYREKEHQSGKWLYLFSLAAFFLSLLSKSVAVVLPPVLLLFDLCYEPRRDIKGLLLDKLPFIIIAGIFCGLAIQSQSFVAQGGGRTSYHGGSLYTTFLTMLPVLVSYLRMVAWPANLSAFYDPPIKSAIDMYVAGAGVVVALLVVSGIVLYRCRRAVFFWFALFFIALIPVSQIIPIVTLMNDRYLYFPMLGAAAFLCLMIFRDMTWSKVCATPLNLTVTACVLLAVAASAAAAGQRVAVWQDSYTLWKDTVPKTPQVAFVHDCFGEGLVQRGQLDEAIHEFGIALSLQPKTTIPNLSLGARIALANTYNNLGTALGMKGMTDQAIESFSAATRLNPGFANAYFNLGNALANKQRLDDALKNFETAVRLNPDNVAFQVNLKQTRELISSKEVGKSAVKGNTSRP